MAEESNSTTGPEIDLKDPVIAGVAAWMVPGLGHFYQGRYFKAVVYCVCILGTFLYGLYLGGSPEVGWGRSVYLSFRPNDYRLPWLCQIGVGFPTVPITVLQWAVERGGHTPWWNGFMAPPSLESPESHAFRNEPEPARKSLAEIHRVTAGYFELGTVFTMIAGLLNVLAIYDACCGPVPGESPKKEEKPDTAEQAEDKS